MNAPTSAPKSYETKLSLSIHDDGPASETPVDSTVEIKTLKVYRVEGEEEISKPFRYKIDLVHVDQDAASVRVPLVAGQVLDKKATLEIKVTDGDPMMRNVHGVIEEFMHNEGVSSNDTTYRVVLVPRLAMLARNRQNRIHATSASQTLEQIIGHKLLSSGPDYGTLERSDRVMLSDDEIRIDIDAADVPLAELSHVVQFNETDLDFIRRLCESHGVYFFFASNAQDTAGMVVFGNTNTPFGVIRFDTEAPVTKMEASDGTTTAVWGPSVTRYDANHKLDIDLVPTGATGLARGSEYTPAGSDPSKLRGALYEFRSVHRPTPACVGVITDRANSDSVLLDATGRGIYTDYDTHFPTRTAGDAFARIRSQEIRAASEYAIGWTNSPCVAPGRTFTKTPEGDLPRATGTTYPKYLVTAVDIEVRQAHADLDITVEGEVVQSGFGNRFRCIEFDEDGDVYRPPRVTPVPRLHGVQTAYVGTGATGEDARPVLDEEGAYRIYSPFLDERAGFLNEKPALTIDKLSKAVRKGEPYAGDGVGMHFPLKRNTEVLVAYRNGDPDRPVIAAAMPGPLDHASPVTEDNPTSHVIETSSGARFEIHDGAEDSDSRIALRSQGASDKASYVRLGKADTASADGPEALEDPYEGKVLTVQGEQRDGIALFTADNIREAAGKDKVTHVQGTIRTDAGEDIYGRSVQRHLLRGRRMVIISGQEADEPAEGETIDVPGTNKSLEDDDMLLLSKGSLYINAGRDIYETSLQSVTTSVAGDEITTTNGTVTKHRYGHETKYTRGRAELLVVGGDIKHGLGFSALGRLGGWLAILGPTGGIPYWGLGVFVWPQIHMYHSLIMVSSTTVVEAKKVGLQKKVWPLSIKANALRIKSTLSEVRISNCCIRSHNTDTVM